MRNSKAAENFRQAMSGEPSHAWLITGEGCHALAVEGAERLLCQAGADKPCGACKGCHMMAGGSHPDYRLLGLPEEGKPPSIKVDEMRELRDWLGQAAQYGRKALVIQGAERMTEQAQNALLRSLEEPPDHCYFLLTGEEGGLLPTIRSRVNPLRLGGGSGPGDPELEEAVLALLQLAGKGDWTGLAAAYGDKKRDFRAVLEMQAVLLRDALAVKLGAPLMTGEEQGNGGQRWQKLAALTVSSPGRVNRWIALTLEARERLDANANPGMVADWLAIHMKRA